LQVIAVWCRVLQCFVVCCSVLQCGAVWCSVVQSQQYLRAMYIHAFPCKRLDARHSRVFTLVIVGNTSLRLQHTRIASGNDALPHPLIHHNLYRAETVSKESSRYIKKRPIYRYMKEHIYIYICSAASPHPLIHHNLQQAETVSKESSRYMKKRPIHRYMKEDLNIERHL